MSMFLLSHTHENNQQLLQSSDELNAAAKVALPAGTTLSSEPPTQRADGRWERIALVRLPQVQSPLMRQISRGGADHWQPTLGWTARHVTADVTIENTRIEKMRRLPFLFLSFGPAAVWG